MKTAASSATRSSGSTSRNCRARRKISQLALAGALSIAGPGMASGQSVGAAQQLERLGPKRDLSVFWVGHSLVEGKARSEWGDNNLIMLVQRFANARGLGYRMGEHTLWGSPLSALWRGNPYSFKRDASAMVARREAFERTAGQYDTMVLTEALPLGPTARNEYGSYYLRRFYCTLMQANPSARVYLYQTWVNFQGTDPYAKFPPPHRFDWHAEMTAQRAVWEELAASAARPGVRAPGRLERFGWTSTSDGGCNATAPIFIVPVGQALVALSDRLSKPTRNDALAWPDGARLRMADFFSNAYIDWPADWPLGRGAADIDSKSVVAKLTRKDPSREHDDIHASALGIYFAALVHFATLYRQTPVGLAAPESIGDGLARALQCIAWTTVVGDPYAGVSGEPGC